MRKHARIIILFILLALLAPLAFAGSETEESLYMEGLNAYIKREFKSAVEKWRMVLEINPYHEKARDGMERAYEKYNSMETHFYRGLSSFENAEYQTAIVEFQETIKINPRHEKALFYLNLC